MHGAFRPQVNAPVRVDEIIDELGSEGRQRVNDLIRSGFAPDAALAFYEAERDAKRAETTLPVVEPDNTTFTHTVSAEEVEQAFGGKVA